MKAILTSLVILSVLAGTVPPTSAPSSSVPLTLTELSSAAGTGFWGGLICGAAAAGVVVGVSAALAAATAGVGSPAAIAVGTSVSLHVFGVCMMMA